MTPPLITAPEPLRAIMRSFEFNAEAVIVPSSVRRRSARRPATRLQVKPANRK